MRRLLLTAFALACLAVLALGGCAMPHSRTATDPDLVIPTDRIYKADLIDKLAKPPQLIFFGGSRSMRFDPAYAQKLTGLRGFNLALTNGKPEDAWAFANWLLQRSPTTRLRWVWGMQESTFGNRDLDSGLLQDARLSQFFPESLLDEQGKDLPKAKSQVPRHTILDERRYAPDGLMLWNVYDERRQNGRTTALSVRLYIKFMKEKLAAEQAAGAAAREAAGAGDSASPSAQPTPRPPSRARMYFEKTIKLLNDHGTTPLIMLMPAHPKALRALPNWQKGREHTLAYLASLQKKYDLAVLDLTDISSFGGDPDEFYDGVHITKVNGDLAIKKMVEAAPQAMK